MTIRRQPHDFQVREVLTDSVRSMLTTAVGTERAHAWLRVTKTSLTTPDVCSMLARSLGVKAGIIAYAGLKDKHATTTQHVSVPVVKSDVRLLAALATSLQDRSWRAEMLGFAPRAIEATDIDRNHFEIIVRGLARRESDTLTRHGHLLTYDGTMTIVNYFGDQRFSGMRKEFAAQHLVRGDFEQALKLLIATPHRKDAGKRRDFTRLAATHWGDWKTLEQTLPHVPEKRAIAALASGGAMREAFAALPNLTQQMSVDAFQAFVWNAAARQCVAMLSNGYDMMTAPDPFGVMLFVTSAGWQKLPLREWMQAEVPMPSPSARGPDVWMRAMAHALGECNLKQEQLQIPGLRRPRFGDAPRPFAVQVRDVNISRAESDECDPRRKHLRITLAFSLPRGAYATVVLRALGQ
jgi:tRNA pseudouridine13 synthase